MCSSDLRVAANNADYYAQRREGQKQRAREWRLRNAERCKVTVSLWREKNGERHKAACAAWHVRNRERQAEKRKRAYAENREHELEGMRRWLIRLMLLAGFIVTVAMVFLRRTSAAEPTLAPVWPRYDEADTGATRVVTPASSTIPDDVPPSQRWSDPVGKACPPGFGVKVKLASGIYHLPGMFAYDRTIPDRCYASAEAARADGFRPAKR